MIWPSVDVNWLGGMMGHYELTKLGICNRGPAGPSRAHWRSFIVTPATLLRWYRRRRRGAKPAASGPGKSSFRSQRLLPVIPILPQSRKQRNETRVTFQRRKALIR